MRTCGYVPFLCMSFLLVTLCSCRYYWADPYYGVPNADLIFAVRTGEMGRVRSVLKRHPELVNLEVMGTTPLVSAATANSLEIATLLLEHGADAKQPVYSQGRPLYTPLGSAAGGAMGTDPYDLVALLVDHGADVNAKDYSSVSVLHSAAHGSSVRVLRLLVDRGADIEAKDSWGATPLLWAAGNAWYEGVKFFLGNGADPLVKDRHDHTALWKAELHLTFLERQGKPDKVQEMRQVIALLMEYVEQKEKEQKVRGNVSPVGPRGKE